MSNPLYPTSDSSGIDEAFETAVWYDDTKKLDDEWAKTHTLLDDDDCEDY